MKHQLTGGNQTDCAMLQWAIDLGKIRTDNPTTKFFPFDSKVKRSSVMVKDTLSERPKTFVMYVKGAAEQVTGLCTHRMTKEGNIEELSQQHVDSIQGAMGTMTCTGLRCLGICFRILEQREVAFKSTVSFTLEDDEADPLFADMVCMGGLHGLRRPGARRGARRGGDVPERRHRGAHGDGRHIAKQCGILTCADHVCMTGGEFRELSDEDNKQLLPRLRVLARSGPTLV